MFFRLLHFSRSDEIIQKSLNTVILTIAKPAGKNGLTRRANEYIELFKTYDIFYETPMSLLLRSLKCKVITVIVTKY